jgi:DHA2 family multidrug resistance protein
MVGPILGPTLGGWLTEAYNWRWVFYINLPVGILTFLGLSAFLSETKTLNIHLDWLGFLSLSLGIGALQMMLDRGEQLDWFSSTEILVEAALMTLGFYIFLVQTFTAKQPFLDPRIFRDRNFAVGVLLIFLVGIILLATLALLTPYLQQLMGYPVLTAGMILAPRGMGTMVAMMICGRLINTVDARLLLTVGFLLSAEVLWEMSGFTPDVSQWSLIRTGVLQGAGLGFMFVPLSTITFVTLAPEYRTQGTALYSLFRNIGASIGISIVVFMLTRNTQIMHAALAEHVTPFNEALRNPAVAQIWNLGTTAGRLALNAEVTRQATIIAYADDFYLMMLISLAALPLVLLLRRATRHGGSRAGVGRPQPVRRASSSSVNAASAKARMFAPRSDERVSSVRTTSIAPLTARQACPAASP